MAEPTAHISKNARSRRRRRRDFASFWARTIVDRTFRSGESRTHTQRPALGEGGANKSILRRNRSADDNGLFARARSIAGTRIAIHKMANAAKNATVREPSRTLADRSL